MKQIRLGLTLLAAGLMLSGCKKEYTGTTQITRALDAREKPNSTRVVLVEPGNYATQVQVGSASTKIVLENVAGKKTFTVVTPKSLSERGIFQNFELSPVEIGQNFGLSGLVNTRVTETAPFNTSERCVYDSYHREVCQPGYWERGRTVCESDRQVCHRIPDGSRDGYRCEWRTERGRCYHEPDRFVDGYCRTETEYVYGTRTSRGFNRTTETGVTIKFTSNTSKTVVGTTRIQDKADTVYIPVSAGPCLR